MEAEVTPEARAGDRGADLGGRERLLKATRCEALDRPPLWLMRQAGRALPEYRKLKERHTFLELVRTPELAAEVTLQPIRRFGFDAAILFSDILVVPEALGQPYFFRETGGVEMEFAIHSAEDIARLEPERVAERLGYVAEVLRLVRAELGGKRALLGFAGSPWTLANYMIHGGSGHDQTGARLLFYNDRALFSQLMEKLTRAVTDFLKLQIAAGADAVQIFDSNGGTLPAHWFEEASARWMRQIVQGLEGGAPVIVFAKGAAGDWPAQVRTGAHVLGVDWSVELAKVAAELPANVGVQGNLDPALLVSTPEVVATETRRLLKTMKGRSGHILNLGHGVTPDAKLECIQALVDTVREFT